TTIGTLAQRLLTEVFLATDPDALARTTISLGHDHVLSHVHQAARQITGVSRAQRRVCQTLTRAVRRDEVLQRRKPFAEVGHNRHLDDAALRVSHQTAHTGELRDGAKATLTGAGQ